MAVVNIALKNFKSESGITKFQVVKGEKFSLFLTPDKEGKTRWFWEHDKVLDTEVIDYRADILAAEVGDATLYIYQGEANNGRGDIIMEIFMKVVDAIAEPASKLSATVGDARPKRPGEV